MGKESTPATPTPGVSATLSYAILALCSVVNVIVKMASWLQRISVLAEKTAFNKGVKVNIHVIYKAPIVLTNSVA